MRSAPKQLNVMGIVLASAKSVFSPMALKPFSRRTCLAVLLLSCHCVHGEDQRWLRVSTDHFIVLTDAGPKKGHEIAARFEQMRAIFAQLLGRKQVVMAKPLEIVAIGNPATYTQLAPAAPTDPSISQGFFLSGEDRIYIVLNASMPDCWRAVEHPMAHYYLDYNYPPTQPWFDEGFAEYFASLYFTLKKTELGSDPELVIPSTVPAPLTIAGGQNANAGLKSLTEILSSPVWLNLTDLLEMRNRVVNGQEGTHHTLFYAQSWMLVHYLINNDKFSEMGTYFGLVQSHHMPVAQAIQQAFGMPPSKLDQAVKDYFHSLKPLAATLEEVKRGSAPLMPEPVNESLLPFGVDEIGDTTKPVPIPEAQALMDEMELRIPARRQLAVTELEKLVDDPKTETLVAHRALAFAHVQKNETDEAFRELSEALQFQANEPWSRFDLALAAYHSGEKGARIQGLANTMESLHIVLIEYPDFAEAYNILGWARLQGGGANAALEAMRFAVRLSPRDESYQLRLADAYLAAKKWDDATPILEHLKASQDAQIAKIARKELDELPFLKKFGIPPRDESGKADAGNPKPITAKSSSPGKDMEDDSDDDPSDSTDSAAKPAPVAKPQIDKRPIKFLKGKVVSVDCSESPTAVVVVSEGKRTLKLRAADYNSVAVIGSAKFSCNWKDIIANVNYRVGGKSDGDLVSVEVQ
jgi:tetratricopeptide (TPR) repeat protein